MLVTHNLSLKAVVVAVTLIQSPSERGSHLASRGRKVEMSAGSFSCTHPPLSAQCTQLTANANSEIAELTAVKSKHGPQEPPSPSPPPPPPPASPPPEEGLTGPTRPAWRVVYKPQRREKPTPKGFPAPTVVPAIEHLKPNLPTWAKWRLNPAHIPASMPAPFSPRPVMLAARLGLFDTSLGVNTPRSNETMPRGGSLRIQAELEDTEPTDCEIFESPYPVYTGVALGSIGPQALHSPFDPFKLPRSGEYMHLSGCNQMPYLKWLVLSELLWFFRDAFAAFHQPQNFSVM
ncbi:hypothetical protein DFJ58DRAFT_867362 [Suillus subalutaceus]|uniref:uncharacterized protein n=1 Tax=Suillus subalutaceus TaxID=48586 RepID=UPI001B87FD3F|nr:uncharacterized protein DFJ58DRAFT_867362 [Suillus subalutaceus]KAG1835854.1 hypothetical protein DFJ58DRAFT_867362 [Suillus subalutaceus]